MPGIVNFPKLSLVCFVWMVVSRSQDSLGIGKGCAGVSFCAATGERKRGRGFGGRRPSSSVRETRGVSRPVLSCSLIVTYLRRHHGWIATLQLLVGGPGIRSVGPGNRRTPTADGKHRSKAGHTSTLPRWRSAEFLANDRYAAILLPSSRLTLSQIPRDFGL